MFGEKLLKRCLGQSAKGLSDTDALAVTAHFVADGLPGDAQHPGNVCFREAGSEKFYFPVDMLFFHSCFVNPPVISVISGEGVVAMRPRYSGAKGSNGATPLQRTVFLACGVYVNYLFALVKVFFAYE